MSRVVLLEGDVENAPGDPVERVLDLGAVVGGDEATLRETLVHALRAARNAGAARVALAPNAQALGFSTQRCAEILIGTLQDAEPGESAPEEVVLVLDGEPTYRIFEAVYDAARIAEQMRRLQGA